jgi:predicted DNA-binding transcriptional regulator AlpA
MSAELATLAQDHGRVAELAPEAIPPLLGELEALKAALWVRLQAPLSVPSPIPTNGKGPDKLLKAEEVAERLGLKDRRAVYRRADSWPFTRRLGDGTLRFSERGLERWQAGR